jgi:hypothetical protein
MTKQQTDRVMNREWKAYQRMKASLTRWHRDKWVLIRGGKLRKVESDVKAILAYGYKEYGNVPFFVTQVGAPGKLQILCYD